MMVKPTTIATAITAIFTAATGSRLKTDAETNFSSMVGRGKRPRESVGDLVWPSGLVNDRNGGPLALNGVSRVASVDDERQIPVPQSSADRDGAVGA